MEAKISWSYNPAQLSANTVYQTRFLIGDTLSNDQQLSDEEIKFSLSLRSSIWGAAATCLRNLSAQYSRLADSVQRDLRVVYSAKSKAYALRAAEFETMSNARGGFAGYCGGISIADKTAQEENSDRVPPNFGIGITDNNNSPVAPAGNELATDWQSDSTDLLI